MTPEALRPVLAQIEQQDDLGKVSWYEVVYHNGTDWKSYLDSNTFKTNRHNFIHTVIQWRYCDEVLPSNIPLTNVEYL